MKDLTVVYYTANKVSEFFGGNVRRILTEAAAGYPIISVSKKPMDFGENIVCNTPQSYVNIYREILIGVKAAKTRYIALAEDDTLYSPEHFKQRPENGVFTYNVGCWGIYTWIDPPIFSWRGRRNNNGLICERDLYIEAAEEKFALFKNDADIPLKWFAEPGKYEKYLGLKERKSHRIYTNPANIMFSHFEGSSMKTIGVRKRLGELRAYEIPYWGHAKDVLKLYG